MATEDGKVLELVVFNLRAGTSRKELLGTVDAVSSWIAGQPGAPEPVGFGPTETDSAYRVLAGTIPRGQPAPPFHIHPHTDEAFYIASGEASFLLGDREVQVTAGGFVFIPRGMPHTAWNSGDGPKLGLIVISPGGAEHLFEPAQTG